MNSEASPYIPAIVAVRQDDGSWAAYDDNKFEGDIESLSIGRGATRREALNDLCEAYCFDTGDVGETLLRMAIYTIADDYPKQNDVIALLGRVDASFAQLYRRAVHAPPEAGDEQIMFEATAVRNEIAKIIAAVTTAQLEATP